MSPAQARCCLMARGAIKMIRPVPDHHAGPRRLSRPERHEKYCSAKASAAANSGCRCLRSLRTMALLSQARWAFGSPYALLALQQRGKHGCFADLGMTGRGEQCQLPVLRKSAQVRQCLGPRWILQLQPVATAEFLEAARVVAVPLAKLV